MKGPRDVARLAQVTALKFRTAQAEMSAILVREAALRANLNDLISRKRKHAETARSPDDAALIAGADLQWHQWVDQRRAVINAELAQVLALKERHRNALKQAFGRDEAVRVLLSRAVKSAAQNQKRRADYTS